MCQLRGVDHEFLETRIHRHVDLGTPVGDPRARHAQHDMLVAVVAVRRDADLPIMELHAGCKCWRGRQRGRGLYPRLRRRDAPDLRNGGRRSSARLRQHTHRKQPTDGDGAGLQVKGQSKARLMGAAPAGQLEGPHCGML